MKPFYLSCSLLFLTACAGQGRANISPGEAQAREIEARHTQNARLDPHTEVQVTQWNAQLRHAERLLGKGQSQAQRDAIDARVRRWDQAAQEVDSYLVLMEVRDADAAQKDPRLDLKRWTFKLSSRGGAPRSATHIELLSQDRFAAESGGAHWRIGARIDFPASRSASSVTLELWAPREAVPKGALRADLPQLPARFEFPAPPRPRPEPKPASLTEIKASR